MLKTQDDVIDAASQFRIVIKSRTHPIDLSGRVLKECSSETFDFPTTFEARKTVAERESRPLEHLEDLEHP